MYITRGPERVPLLVSGNQITANGHRLDVPDSREGHRQYPPLHALSGLAPQLEPNALR
jgi:hypothetical protein